MQSKSLTACGPRMDRSTNYRNGRRNEQDGGAGCFHVQADMVHFDAVEEILDVEGKIAALEAQSANVHDESNAQKVGTKGAASVPEESSGSQSVQLGCEWQKRCSKVLAFEKENEEVGSDR